MALDGCGSAEGTACALGDSDCEGVPDDLGRAVLDDDGNWLTTDLDGDGVSDGPAVDTNGDGIPDGALIDTDGDGLGDALDLDGDGVPDVFSSVLNTGGGACVPGASQVCVCTDGSSGSQECNSAGTAFDASVCSGPSGTGGSLGTGGGGPSAGSGGSTGAGCATTPTVMGAITFDGIPITFSSATATLQHNRDVDVADDRCVTGFAITLNPGAGCPMTLQTSSGFDESYKDAQGHLLTQYASLLIDDQCPGASMPQEAVYTGPSDAIPVVEFSSPLVPDSNAETSCLCTDVTVHIPAGMVLNSNIGSSSVAGASTVVVSGCFVSTGDAIRCSPVQ